MGLCVMSGGEDKKNSSLLITFSTSAGQVNILPDLPAGKEYSSSKAVTQKRKGTEMAPLGYRSRKRLPFAKRKSFFP